MDIAALKAIPISDLLQRLGYAPVKQRGRELSYFAPYRQEHEPSLRVNVEKNLFYDFGIAQGGDIFKLAGLLCHSDDFKNQANFIVESMNVQLPMKEHPVSFSQRKEPSFEDVEIRELSNRYLIWYLRDRGISAEVAKANCDEIHYWLNGKEYYAIGFKNIAGGFELRNKFAKLCIPPKEVSLIAGDTIVCNVYEGFMDYLSAVQMGEQKTESAIVLNSVSNVHRAFRHLDTFAEIRCYLDNDDAGRQALKTLSEKYPDKVIDRSSLYQGHNDVNDYLMAITPKKTNKLKI
ncbi:MAG: toprim domain-containing protein [Muribaculum sp.]|nr:toprim domain-containing protein [Muribaculum sp.]